VNLCTVAAVNASDVHIWCRSTESLDGEAVRSADQHLSFEERVRRDRFHFEADRRDFTIAHDLLRRALSKHTGIASADLRFATSGHGKPSIDSADPQLRALSFSLSHTRGFVACAVTSHAPLGIDVEQVGQSQNVREVANRYFSEKEAAWLRRSPDELRSVRFAELWTLKEAFLKAIGVGLSGSLADASFWFDELAPIEFSTSSTIGSHGWHFALFEPIFNLRLGIAIRNVPGPRFFIRQGEDDGHSLVPIRASVSFLTKPSRQI
jgi:phosphopantetheinyl transferase